MSNVPSINRTSTTKELVAAVAESVLGHEQATTIGKGVTTTPVHTVRRIRLLLAIEALLRHFASYPKVWDVVKVVSDDFKKGQFSSIDKSVMDAIGYAETALKEQAGITDLKPYTFYRGDNVLSGYSFVHNGRKIEFAVSSSDIATTELTYTMMNIFKTACERAGADNVPVDKVDEIVLSTLMMKRPGTNSDMFHIFKCNQF